MPRLAAALTVFASSAAVLVLEILAGRLLAPHVGVTLETYTGIIGTVLAGIAVGAWYGGKLADRHDPRRLLGPMLVGGGVLALLALPVVTFLGAALPTSGPLAIVVLSAAGFFAPAAVLSAVTPTVIKLQLDSLDETGQVVGRLSALGTAGAIFGTFLTGFVLIAALPSRPIILAVGVALVGGGALLWRWLAPRGSPSLAPYLVLGGLAVALTLGTTVPCDVESTYFCARVTEDPDHADGRVLVLDRMRHSYVDLDDPTHLEFTYTAIFGDLVDVLAPAEDPIDALHIGGGGFTLPRYIAATRPGSHSTVYEIDPGVVEIAERELGLDPSRPDVEIIVDDARMGVEAEPTDAYDLVIGDAFGGLAVPWHLTTVEFLEQLQRVLRDEGIYTVNVIDYPPAGFARAKGATLRAVFDHLALVAAPEQVAGVEGGNYVYLAADAPLPLEDLAEASAQRDHDATVVTGEELAAFIGDAQVLVDDHAPVDQLITPPYAR